MDGGEDWPARSPANVKEMVAAMNISMLPETECAKNAVDQPKKGVANANVPAAKSALERVAPRRMAVRKRRAVARADRNPLTPMIAILARSGLGYKFESVESITRLTTATRGIARNERPGALSA